MIHFKQFSFKKFGYRSFEAELLQQAFLKNIQDYIKIIYLQAGTRIVIDFKLHELVTDTLFFINAGQFYKLEGPSSGSIIYYNRDFYCVEIHDKEVACDGILFHNVYDIPAISLNNALAKEMRALFNAIQSELMQEESSLEEMLRILLKQLIIKATRIWKRERQVLQAGDRQELEFLRHFSQLVEWHYKQLHTVADYAALLNISPKALNKRLNKAINISPNELIKDRIILETQRLLAHTTLSIKEISYLLGYNDISYFIRLFSKKTNMTPQTFRNLYKV